jgi:hypothetical protein
VLYHGRRRCDDGPFRQETSPTSRRLDCRTNVSARMPGSTPPRFHCAPSSRYNHQLGATLRENVDNPSIIPMGREREGPLVRARFTFLRQI